MNTKQTTLTQGATNNANTEQKQPKADNPFLYLVKTKKIVTKQASEQPQPKHVFKQE